MASACNRHVHSVSFYKKDGFTYVDLFACDGYSVRTVADAMECVGRGM